MSGSDHNYQITRDELRQFVERIERLEDDKKAVSEDIKEVFAEAKARGYDTKAMRLLLKERKKSPEELDEINAILDMYRAALGMTALDI